MSEAGRQPYDIVKRGIDIWASIVGLVITAPLQLATAAIVMVSMGRPILFRQSRPGKDAEVFELVKFRTMLLPDDQRQTDEQRLTKTGQFLRSTSLDELPTLWNVLKGDMSLVGPRPLRVSYLSLYSDEQARRHEVRPGITGLAQVSGRNTLGWDERLALDVEYVQHRGTNLDLRILWMTVGVVLGRQGISADGNSTMPDFVGPMRTHRIRLARADETFSGPNQVAFSDDDLRSDMSTSGDLDSFTSLDGAASQTTDGATLKWVGVDLSSNVAVSLGRVRLVSKDVGVPYIYVDTRWRHQGLGTETLQMLLSGARGSKIRTLRVVVDENDEVARSICERTGFAPDPVQPSAGQITLSIDLMPEGSS